MRILVIGGGAIGSAIAFFLQADPGFRGEIVVVERDPSYRRASSALSASSIRQQFSTPLNIAMSAYGWAFYRDLGERLAASGSRPEAGLTEHGYLYLLGADAVASARRVNALQRDEGADIALLTPDAIAARYPWLALEGVALGSLGLSGEGWFDGYAVLQAFRAAGQVRGVRWVQAEVSALEGSTGHLHAARLDDGTRVAFDVAVNAAGPWAARVAAMADIELPVRARRRSVFVFRSPEPAPGCPLVIDPQGLWFRKEGEGFIGGVPPADDADDLPLEPELGLWESSIWPALAARVPGFEAARLTGGWAGYYDFNTFDHNAVLGRHPSCDNLYFANGFSGHGMQHAPAAGRGLAELILHGAYRSLDLSALGFDRILANRPYLEQNVIG